MLSIGRRGSNRQEAKERGPAIKNSRIPAFNRSMERDIEQQELVGRQIALYLLFVTGSIQVALFGHLLCETGCPVTAVLLQWHVLVSATSGSLTSSFEGRHLPAYWRAWCVGERASISLPSSSTSETAAVCGKSASAYRALWQSP